ncbi:MAG: tetratricopeptide repeat protein [Burkholderiales bacterium]|jgi:tetratricopeptide (TPR) repeat protein|nr:tetratricopeptide repeat protein [Burkholderiales bacterium]
MHPLPPLLLCAAAALHVPGALAMYPESTEPVANQADPDFTAGKAAVKAKDWPRAIAALNAAARRDNNNADIHNLLGYAQRNNGNFGLALKHYDRALTLDPKHLGAREYLGELHLQQNNLAKAEEQRAELTRLCPKSCEELTELSEKIDDYKKKLR